MNLLEKITAPQTLIAFGIGTITGIVILHYGIKITPPKKHYPISVQCYWSTNGYQSYPKFECDSIRGDTAWKDGRMIITKNIVSVSFQ